MEKEKKQNDAILIVSHKQEEKFLRAKTVDFDFKKFKKTEVKSLLERMRRAMRKANGIGLSANQIGLEHKVFIAEVPSEDGRLKFYAFFNPKIEKLGKELVPFEEGCLSVPLTFGSVMRPDQIVVSGLDKNGKPMKIKAWGLLARVFQHEIDHLNGTLFIDKAKETHTMEGGKKK